MTTRIVGLFAAGALLAGCSGEQPGTSQSVLTAPIFAVGGNTGMNMGTHLRGEEEVLVVPAGAPTPADSRAQGQATFRVNDDGTVDFKLIASNIDNVIMAHIHCGRPGTNGPIRMWLSPTVGPSGVALPPGGRAARRRARRRRARPAVKGDRSGYLRPWVRTRTPGKATPSTQS